jgi:hypothetical protein
MHRHRRSGRRKTVENLADDPLFGSGVPALEEEEKKGRKGTFYFLPCITCSQWIE